MKILPDMISTSTEMKPYSTTLRVGFENFLNWFDVVENKYELLKTAPKDFILVNDEDLISTIDAMLERLMILKSFIPGHFIRSYVSFSQNKDDKNGINFDTLEIETEHAKFDLFKLCGENSQFAEIFNHVIAENIKTLMIYKGIDSIINSADEVKDWIDKLFNFINYIDTVRLTTVYCDGLKAENLKTFLQNVIPIANELVGRHADGSKIDFNYNSDIIVKLSTDVNKNFKHTVFSEGFGMQNLNDAILINMLILK